MNCELCTNNGEVPLAFGDGKLTPIPCPECYPDTEPILGKIDRLGKELTAVTEAVRSVQGGLTRSGVKADEERWCLADISYLTNRGLELIDTLKGCVKALDIEKLPRLIGQADTCIKNTSSVSIIAESGAELPSPAVDVSSCLAPV